MPISFLVSDTRAPMQRGVTLVELMIAMALGLSLALAGASLLVSSKSAYFTQTESVSVHETGRHAIELIAWSLRQAGYVDWSNVEGAPIEDTQKPSLSGLDAHSLKSTTPGIDMALKRSVNGSDVLDVRFAGAGKEEQGDGSILNCAGFSIPAPTDMATAERGRSIFYVAEDATGEPELRCKYKGKTSWSSVAIARGVESFQVLYGVDTDADGFANAYVSANEVRAMDDALVLDSVDVAAQVTELSRKTNWRKIVAVKVALMVRGEHKLGSSDSSIEYDLFGKEYGDQFGRVDPGVRLTEKSFPVPTRNRVRKIFDTTVLLRNHVSTEPV